MESESWHDAVLTTFTSYGAVRSSRQGEIIRDLAKPAQSELPTAIEIARAVARELRGSEQLADRST